MEQFQVQIRCGLYGWEISERKKKLFANFSPLTLFVANGCRCCATMMLTPFFKIIKILCCLTSKDHFACQRCWSYGKIALLIKKLFHFARDVGKGSKSFSRHYNFVIIFQVTKGKFFKGKCLCIKQTHIRDYVSSGALKACCFEAFKGLTLHEFPI